MIHFPVLAWAYLALPLTLQNQEELPRRLLLAMPGRTVHNSTYVAAAFLYDVQTLLGATGNRPNVLDGSVVQRVNKDLYLALERLTPEKAARFLQIAGREPPVDELGFPEMSAYMQEHYYEITVPYPDLNALLAAHPYRDNPDWLTVPVESATFKRKRVLRIHKERIADALAQYFENNDRLIFPAGTVIVAESLNKRGGFVEAEVLRKRADTFWNFSVYDDAGRLVKETISFNEEGEVDRRLPGFAAPQSCALCHRIDRLDFSGDPESPSLAPVRGFFHRLPLRVPEIDLGVEYYDHMAFTELTETHARAKDAVFGVYGSLMLSELAGRKRLGTLSPSDKTRYRRLQPLYPELLTSLDRIDSVTNSIGMTLLRIPSKTGTLIGSPRADPEHRPDERRHEVAIPRPFFMASTKVTNGQFRLFRPGHHSPSYRGVDLDGDLQPVVNVSYEDALAFIAWLNGKPEERKAGRTYRLPTEEEWEYSAKGGDDRRFPWGDQWPPPPGSGNFGDETNGAVMGGADWPFLHHYRDGYAGTSPVGSFYPNSHFLYDMAGNAYEWTSSAYLPYPGATETGGIKPYSGTTRVARGSSWGDELAKVMRCAFRFPIDPGEKLVFLGFRVLADIPSLN